MFPRGFKTTFSNCVCVCVFIIIKCNKETLNNDKKGNIFFSLQSNQNLKEKHIETYFNSNSQICIFETADVNSIADNQNS